MKPKIDYRDMTLRTSVPAGEMWHAYEAEILGRLWDTTDGLISPNSDRLERRRAA